MSEQTENRIILVSDTRGFMVNAMIREFKNDGFSCTEIPLDVDAISGAVGEGSVILLYLDGVKPGAEALTYISDLIHEKQISVTVIGREDDLATVNDQIPKETLAAEYLRPVNVKDLGQHFREVFDHEAARHAKKKILVVDDDGMMLRRIKEWLSGHYQVYMVNSGMNAITFLAKNSVDLILLDYEMPVTSGPQVLEMLRSEPETASIPVMFLTAKSDRESVMKVLSLKPEKYLLKTQPPAALVADIDAFFAEHPA